MNIFAIEGNTETGEIDFIKSAQSLDDLRVVKMFTESCQIMSTALRRYGIDAPYKSFNPKHPSCLWAADSFSNFLKLFEHATELASEYLRRFGNKQIFTKRYDLLAQILDLAIKNKFPDYGETPFLMAVPANYIIDDNPILSYRKFYSDKPNLRYIRKNKPSWL